MNIKDLVKLGYFPKELLPVFSTDDLGNVLHKIVPKVDGFEQTGSIYNIDLKLYIKKAVID